LINSVRKNRVGAAGAQQKDGWGCQDEHQVLEPVGNWQRVSSRNGSSTNLQRLLRLAMGFVSSLAHRTHSPIDN